MTLPSNALLLITGATGHTGNKLTRRLLKEGYRVRILSRSKEKVAKVFGPGFEGETFLGDLEQPASLPAALKGCDALVSLSHVRFAPVLVEACRRTGVLRALFTSSARRYTRFPDPTADAVRTGEAAIRESGLEFTIIRPTMIFGDERDANLTHLVRLLRRLPVFPVPGGGSNLVQPTFVHDLVNVIVRALQSPAALCKEYDIAGPDPLTYRAMIRSIAGALGKKVWVAPIPLAATLWLIGLYEKVARRPRVTRDQIRRFGEDKTVDITRARRELGYAPISFDEAIARKITGNV
jgi:uncharacterized protein YbjT (DUF2867 family)